ncbi:FYVE and coiled-coil domain-containing protein 1 [Scleropages formosus]|uniref:FYVE and coiled-coil domain-containing protein 1 n=1 Tax=Scleropages formosus TaxID=113540 RepID=A0A8C9QYM4_SCLFO|nr:FYVE and coiled-coil domain-containing protein 1-like [Scleropages formosus]XP_018596322.2 FYVE and coiled-coil domain-containing protein 1-like [Scleropages formosus]XP_018596323.2 FYVE and coiled-coil domain-containing protein 1-like [Scleropages formosus]
MAAAEAVGTNQLLRIIRDLQEAVAELTREYRENGEPITDDSANLHRFSYKLEYLLQFDQKEKTTFLGTRKDYWDYFSDCLAKVKGANDGIRFVKSIPELKTSLGKGRAFIRYSLVHQRLADTLQQCLINQKVTSDWYYTRSPLLKPHLSVDIINHLYELNDVQFDIASRGHDLDSAWPTFARRSLGTPGSPLHLWRPPSRSSSINSLVSSYSQHIQEFPSSPDLAPGLLDESGELREPGERVSAAEDLRLELDQSELRQQQLLARASELGEEASELRTVVGELQAQLDASLAIQAGAHEQKQELEALRSVELELRTRLASTERKNEELLARLGEALDEKGQQAASHFDSAQKIHDLLDELSEVEREKLEAVREVEGKKREVERLAEDLRVKEEALEKERTKALAKAKELREVMESMQGELENKEKESSDLQRKLEDLQYSLKAENKKVDEVSRRAQEEKGELQQKLDSLKVSLEGQLATLTEQLRAKDEQLTASREEVELMEKQVVQLTGEKKGLAGIVAELESKVKDQTKKTEEYKMQCTTLMELNSKLLQTVKKNEETKRELMETKATMEGEFAALQASEKQLRSQIEDGAVAVDERERRLREENRQLDESIRKATAAKEMSEGTVRELEQENRDLKEERQVAEGALSAAREELQVVTSQIAELETRLATTLEGEASLHQKLQKTAALLEDREGQCRQLEGRLKELSEEKADLTSCLALAKSQLELSTGEVSRLQAELLDVRTELRCTAEAKHKIQARLESTEVSREELAAQIEWLKAQEEELRQQHASAGESLTNDRDQEAQARAKLAAELASTKEELLAIKALHESLAVERAETREGLHRANTEMAELGVTVCRLTSENQEAERRREMEEREAERLSAGMAALRLENASLQEELGELQNLPQTIQELKERLEQAEAQAKSIQEATQEKIETIKFQMSSEALKHQNELKGISEELGNLEGQLAAERQSVTDLTARVSELKAVNSEHSQVIEEKILRVAECEVAMQRSGDELQQLKGNLTRMEGELVEARSSCEDLRQTLSKTLEEKCSLEVKMSAEIEELRTTKMNLEERLIELIRDKDTLWQKSDALEFQQKLRAEEQWWLVDKEASHCLGCRSAFTWWLRRHHCRLCGRIFCYYCSNNFVLTKHSGKKERSCRECYSQHSAVVERLTQAELGPNRDEAPAIPCPASALSPAPYTPLPRVTVTDPGDRSDDSAFDIITEEELNGMCDSDSAASQQTSGAEISGSGSTEDAAPDDSEELTPALQDTEIHLLKSGELTLAVPLGIEEVVQFGDSSRELSIRSSCYSTVPITVPEAGPTISWVFSSEPKSVSFSVVYSEAADAPVEQSKVLIPLTRCSSHQETIQGQLKVRNPGVYTLIFDNSFSRFISKKVLYHLAVEKPVIYDGSDFP